MPKDIYSSHNGLKELKFIHNLSPLIPVLRHFKPHIYKRSVTTKTQFTKKFIWQPVSTLDSGHHQTVI